MALPSIHWTGRTTPTHRCGMSRGLKRLLRKIHHAWPKSKSRPNTLTLFDIVTLNCATKSNGRRRNSKSSVAYKPTPSLPRSPREESLSTIQSPIATPGFRSARRPRGPMMADRIVDVRLQSLYDDEDDSCRGYVFAGALQDAWHDQDIEALSSSPRC